VQVLCKWMDGISILGPEKESLLVSALAFPVSMPREVHVLGPMRSWWGYSVHQDPFGGISGRQTWSSCPFLAARNHISGGHYFYIQLPPPIAFNCLCQVNVSHTVEIINNM